MHSDIKNYQEIICICIVIWPIALFFTYSIPWIYKKLKEQYKLLEKINELRYWKRHPIEACNMHPSDLDITRCDHISPKGWQDFTWVCNKPKGHSGRHRAWNMMSWDNGEFLKPEELEEK